MFDLRNLLGKTYVLPASHQLELLHWYVLYGTYVEPLTIDIRLAVTSQVMTSVFVT